VLSGSSVSFLLGPLTAFGRSMSLVERRPKVGPAGAYGLLVPVAAPGTFVEGEVLRRRLEAEGVRATLVPTGDGPRVMVFPDSERVARAILAR
jgi:hypothetical protein